MVESRFHYKTGLLFLVTRVADEAEDDYDESVADVVDNVAIGNACFCITLDSCCHDSPSVL